MLKGLNQINQQVLMKIFGEGRKSTQRLKNSLFLFWKNYCKIHGMFKALDVKKEYVSLLEAGGII